MIAMEKHQLFWEHYVGIAAMLKTSSTGFCLAIDAGTGYHKEKTQAIVKKSVI